MSSFGLTVTNSSGDVVIDTSKATWSVLTTVTRGAYDSAAPLTIQGFGSDASAKVVVYIPTTDANGTTTKYMEYYTNNVITGTLTETTSSTGGVTTTSTGNMVPEGSITLIAPLSFARGPLLRKTVRVFDFTTNTGTVGYYSNNYDSDNFVLTHEEPLIVNSYSYRSYELNASTVTYPVPGASLCSEVIVARYNVGTQNPAQQEVVLYTGIHKSGVLSTFGGNTATAFVVLGR